MRVDLRVPSCAPAPQIVEFCQRAEKAGFSGVGLLDTQMYLRDTYVVAAQILTNTERLRVHPAVTCPGPRHVSVIASAAKTVQELAPHRFELWLGRGGSANTAVGLPTTRLNEMRQVLTDIRGLADGGSVNGARMFYGGGERLPILMAASGPRVTRLAAELCDGVVFRAGPNGEAIDEVRAWMQEGAEMAGRSLEELHQWYEMRCVARSNREDAVRTWSPLVLAVLASDNAETWLAKNRIDYTITPSMKGKFHEAHRVVSNLYPDRIHAVDWDAAVSIAQVIPYELQEAMGDRMAVLGPPDYIGKRMEELEELGVENIFLYPCWTFQLPEPELEAFAEVTRKRLAAPS